MLADIILSFISCGDDSGINPTISISAPGVENGLIRIAEATERVAEATNRIADTMEKVARSGDRLRAEGYLESAFKSLIAGVPDDARHHLLNARQLDPSHFLLWIGVVWCDALESKQGTRSPTHDSEDGNIAFSKALKYIEAEDGVEPLLKIHLLCSMLLLSSAFSNPTLALSTLSLIEKQIRLSDDKLILVDRELVLRRLKRVMALSRSVDELKKLQDLIDFIFLRSVGIILLDGDEPKSLYRYETMLDSYSASPLPGASKTLSPCIAEFTEIAELYWEKKFDRRRKETGLDQVRGIGCGFVVLPIPIMLLGYFLYLEITAAFQSEPSITLIVSMSMIIITLLYLYFKSSYKTYSNYINFKKLNNERSKVENSIEITKRQLLQFIEAKAPVIQGVKGQRNNGSI